MSFLIVHVQLRENIVAISLLKLRVIVCYLFSIVPIHVISVLTVILQSFQSRPQASSYQGQDHGLYLGACYQLPIWAICSFSDIYINKMSGFSARIKLWEHDQRLPNWTALVPVLVGPSRSAFTLQLIPSCMIFQLSQSKDMSFRYLISTSVCSESYRLIFQNVHYLGCLLASCKEELNIILILQCFFMCFIDIFQSYDSKPRYHQNLRYCHRCIKILRLSATFRNHMQLQ